MKPCSDDVIVGVVSSRRLPLYLLFLAVSLLFLVVNLVCALLVKMTATNVKTVVLVRVAINDSLFVLCAVSLSICLYKVAKMSLANIYLESKVKLYLTVWRHRGLAVTPNMECDLCAGDLGVSGDLDRRDGGAAVRIAGLLQPGGARPRRHREHQLF